MGQALCVTEEDLTTLGDCFNVPPHSGFGFGVWGLGFGVWGLGFGFEVWDLGLGFSVWDLGLRFWV